MATGKSTPPPAAGVQRAIPEEISEVIELERRRLQKASSVLASLAFSVNHDADDVDPGDVASVVRDLVDQAVAALDSVELEKSLRR